MIVFFRCWLTWVVLDKGTLNIVVNLWVTLSDTPSVVRSSWRRWSFFLVLTAKKTTTATQTVRLR